VDVTLVLVQQDQQQREVPLRKPTVVVGRDVACQIRIPSESVSRRHCEISLDGDSLSIKDLGSSNGTFVNRRRVTHAELAPGDVIGLGSIVLAVRIDGKPRTIDSATALSMAPAAPTAPPQAAKSAAAAKPVPGRPSSILDDDSDEDDPPARNAEMEESSLSDFDFLDDEDDEKDQPKL